jgi:Family of unknown function (DUF5335)
MNNEIGRTQWKEYFQGFNQRNFQRPTGLEIFSDLGAQREESHLPLLGIAVEELKDNTVRIGIMLGDSPGAGARHLTHAINQVCHIYSKLSAEGRDEAIEFEDASGVKTLLRFEALAELTTAH